eukprot:270431-Prymnesium_polylepis.1
MLTLMLGELARFAHTHAVPHVAPIRLEFCEFPVVSCNCDRSLREANFTVKELRNQTGDEGKVFTTRQIVQARFSVKELREGGYSARELRAEGLSVPKLHAAGYTL